MLAGKTERIGSSVDGGGGRFWQESPKVEGPPPMTAAAAAAEQWRCEGDPPRHTSRRDRRHSVSQCNMSIFPAAG